MVFAVSALISAAVTAGLVWCGIALWRFYEDLETEEDIQQLAEDAGQQLAEKAGPIVATIVVTGMFAAGGFAVNPVAGIAALALGAIRLAVILFT